MQDEQNDSFGENNENSARWGQMNGGARGAIRWIARTGLRPRVGLAAP